MFGKILPKNYILHFFFHIYPRNIEKRGFQMTLLTLVFEAAKIKAEASNQGGGKSKNSRHTTEELFLSIFHVNFNLIYKFETPTGTEEEN